MKFVVIALFSVASAQAQMIVPDATGQWGPLPSQNSNYTGPTSLDTSLVPDTYASASWVIGKCLLFMGLPNGDLLGSCSYHRGFNEGLRYANVRWQVFPDNTSKALEAVPCSKENAAMDVGNHSPNWRDRKGCFKYPK